MVIVTDVNCLDCQNCIDDNGGMYCALDECLKAHFKYYSDANLLNFCLDNLLGITKEKLIKLYEEEQSV